MISVIATEMVDLADLRPYPGNPRTGDIELIQESVRLNGQFRALVVNKSTNEVLAGNHLLHALLGEGYKTGLVSYVDVDEATARKINLIDNRSHDDGDYDLETLLAQVTAGPLEGTGFDEYSLDALIERNRALPALDGPAVGDELDDDPNVLKMRWTRTRIVMTEEEYASVVKLYNQFRVDNQSDIGFGFHLVERD